MLATRNKLQVFDTVVMWAFITMMDDVVLGNRAVRGNPNDSRTIAPLPISALDCCVPVINAGRSNGQPAGRRLPVHESGQIKTRRGIGSVALTSAVSLPPCGTVLNAGHRMASALIGFWRRGWRSTGVAAANLAGARFAALFTDERNHRFIIAPAWC